MVSVKPLFALGCALSAYPSPLPNFFIGTPSSRRKLSPESGLAPFLANRQKCTQVLSFQDFARNSHGLKILPTIPKTELLFSRFYGYRGGGGTYVFESHSSRGRLEWGTRAFLPNAKC
jgi:hypothetical protein